jgi:hypothetical protein
LSAPNADYRPNAYGEMVNRNPYYSGGYRITPSPSPTGQLTYARDPLTGAYGFRAVLGSAQAESNYANQITGGRTDSSFSTGLGVGSWR